MPASSSLVALNAAGGLHRAAICRLALDLETLKGASSSAATARALGVRRSTLRRALDVLARAADVAGPELDRASRLGFTVLTLAHDHYPAALRDLPLPPPVLYCSGTLPTSPKLSIVGSRRASEYGLEVAELFARHLACSGIAIISGLAPGVDAAAHRGALAASDGSTVGVLGCGLDVDYPRQNSRLRGRIRDRGSVVSEFPLGTPPLPHHFPIRNRLIAAFGVGLIVVEAAARSGSLITARHALDLGRNIYAVPGRIFDSRAIGPNALIRDGAFVAQHPRDIVESLPWNVQDQLSTHLQPEPEALPAPRTPAAHLLAHLEPGDKRTADELAVLARSTIDSVLALLLELELSGWVRRVSGGQFVRAGDTYRLSSQ